MDRGCHAFELSFQDYFANDTVTCFVNDCLIFDGWTLNSELDVGLTNVVLKFANNEILLGSEVLEVSCSPCLMPRNEIAVILNGHKEVFRVDLDKGVYIGFDKIADRVRLNQSASPFIYD
jgi:hypothetical protein